MGLSNLKSPKKGRLARLLDMAQQNAEQAFFQAQNATRVREETLVFFEKASEAFKFPVELNVLIFLSFKEKPQMASNVVF